ncbi:hypothetical protein [Moritella sp. F3]|uniref:hypothetical protein n=1 Tax=Moritella sp. F3 TaxID=2718882 RepID=UPI0018E17F39|nr:hypothetical protein [Moritella sp. F3]GIC77128.1 hypothetical protein FMO001_18550 [Moritella sp. F1]GIC82247.1 hypothetical protein FMO003_25280 [Moritella sp. F3]
MNKFIVLITLLVMSGCSDNDTGKMSTHEAYSALVDSGAFPARMEGDLTKILDGSTQFRMEQYFEFASVISKHCSGPEASFAASFLIKVVSFVFPMDLRVFNNPIIAIERQVDAANTCEFKPLNTYIG